MSDLPWFRYEPERTATGFRWLDLLTDPYWRVSQWLTERSLWKLLVVGDETWREARVRFRASYRALKDMPERPSVEELIEKINEEANDD